MTVMTQVQVSLTDFENAAYTIFIVLLSRVILAFDLNLYDSNLNPRAEAWLGTCQSPN